LWPFGLGVLVFLIFVGNLETCQKEPTEHSKDVIDEHQENVARGRQQTSTKHNKETMQATNTNIAQQKKNVSYEHQKSIAKKQCKVRNNANHEQRKSTRLK
jgi:hypothetical protein